MKKILFTLITFSLLTSCGSHKYIPEITNKAESKIEINEHQKLSLFINSITLTSQSDLSESYRNRLISDLKSFYVFNDVMYNVSKQNMSDYISLDIIINEKTDFHQAGNLYKAYFTGFFLWLPAPFMKFGYDYGVEITYNFSKNNLKKQIITKSERRLSKKLNSKQTEADLIASVNSDVKNQLKDEIRSNLDFFIKQ